MDITAKLLNGNDRNDVVREITVQFDMPTTLAGFVERFGEPIVVDHLVDSITIAAQAALRGMLKKTGDDRMSDAAIIKKFAEWKPGTRKAADPAKRLETMKKLAARMSKEELKAFMRDMRNG